MAVVMVAENLLVGARCLVAPVDQVVVVGLDPAQENLEEMVIVLHQLDLAIKHLKVILVVMQILDLTLIPLVVEVVVPDNQVKQLDLIMLDLVVMA